MLRSRALRHLALLATAVAGVSCGDVTGSIGPDTEGYVKFTPTRSVVSSFALLPREARAKAVKWSSSHSPTDQTASAWIDASGGVLELPGSDFTMHIPQGALSSPTLITITSVAGPYVMYDMEPHGLQFQRPITAVQHLRNTAIYGSAEGNRVRSAYLSTGNHEVAPDGTASPDELQAATTLFYGRGDVADTHVWTLNHFSRWLLVSGVWVLVKD